jgi:hypothetical protein
MRYLAIFFLLALVACFSSNKVYTAPAMGAESQFDKGLRPEKHPKYLFDKKTMKEMKSMGTVSSYSPSRKNTAPTIPLPKKNNEAADSLNKPGDSTQTSADTAKTSQPPADTTVPFSR